MSIALLVRRSLAIRRRLVLGNIPLATGAPFNRGPATVKLHEVFRKPGVHKSPQKQGAKAPVALDKSIPQKAGSPRARPPRKKRAAEAVHKGGEASCVAAATVVAARTVQRSEAGLQS